MRKFQETVSSTTTGLPIFKAQVTVFQADGTTPVTVYSDAGITPITGPVLTNGTGLFFFFVPDGTYTLKIADPNGVLLQTLTKVEIYEDARNVSVPVGEPAIILPSIGTRAGKLAIWGPSGSGAPLVQLDVDILALADQISDDAAQTAADRLATGLDVDDADAILAQVEANTAAYGSNVRVFDTKASATAAIGTTLVNGMFAEIMSDEGDLNLRTRRAVSGGALQAVSAELPKLINGAESYYMATTFTRFIQLLDPSDNTLKPFIAPHIYIDEYNGSDSNDGLHGYDLGSGRGPIKTIAKLITMPQCIDGMNLAIRYYADKVSRLQVDFAEPNTLNGNKQLSRLSVVPYDNNGKLLRMWGTDPVAVAAVTGRQSAITAHATISGAYEIQWTHDIPVTSAALRVLQKQSNLDFEPLHRVAAEASCSTAGRYWYDSSLSAYGTERIVFKPWAGVNALTAGDGFFEITRRCYAVSGRDDCFIAGIWGFAHGHNNGSIFTYARPVVQRCLAELGGKHNWTLGAGYITDVIAVNAVSSSDYWPEGGTIMEEIFEAILAGKTAVMTRCGAFCDDGIYTHALSGADAAQALYAHGVTGGNGALFQMNDCWNANTGGGGSQTIFTAWEINGHFSAGCNNANAGLAQNLPAGFTVRVRNSVFTNVRREFSDNSSGVTLDVQGNIFIAGAAISGGVVYLGNSNHNLTLKNNLFHADVVTYTPFVAALSITGLTVDIENNIFSRSLAGVDFGTVVASFASAIINNNYYDMIADPGGSSDPYVARYNAHLYKTTQVDDRTWAQWQALGYDTTGAYGAYNTANTADSVNWLGPLPTSANPEYAVLDPASPMAGKITLPSVSTILAMKARPVTRAAAVAYLETQAPRFAVYAG